MAVAAMVAVVAPTYPTAVTVKLAVPVVWCRQKALCWAWTNHQSDVEDLQEERWEEETHLDFQQPMKFYLILLLNSILIFLLEVDNL
jgi:hypothetical protein